MQGRDESECSPLSFMLHFAPSASCGEMVGSILNGQRSLLQIILSVSGHREHNPKSRKFFLTKSITTVILPWMKTAISIPDPIFKTAEQAAKALGISRSELYTKAIKEFLETYLHTDITRELNEIYADESSQLDRELSKIQSASIQEEDW